MSSIVISGDTSGSVTLQAPAASGSTILTLPSTSGSVLTSGSVVTVPQGGTGVTSLTANNVILGNGTSAVAFVAPGTAGNLLTSDGTTWASTAATGGMTLLGTITPTAVNSISLGSLTLTSYKSLYIVFNNISVSNKLFFISSSNVQTGGGALLANTGGTTGTAWLDLGTGSIGGGISDNTISSTSGGTIGGLTNVTTSSTTIYFRSNTTGNFVAQGSIVIYGVK